jgi:hypothetical protein
MSSTLPPWLDPQPGSTRARLRTILLLCAIFVVGFALTRGNPNAGLFLFLAVVCVGLAAIVLFASGLRRFGGTVRTRSGQSERDVLVLGLLLVALLTPWTITIKPLSWQQTFGFASPITIVAIVGVALTRIHRLRSGRVVAIAVAGIALVAWIGWLTLQLQSSAFRNAGFPFLPIDLIGDGWFIGLLAFATAVDGLAVEASAEDRPARARDVWPFAIVPGAGLVRMSYRARGRLWLIAVGLCIFLVQASAVSPDEFAYYGSLGALPPPGSRAAAIITLVLAVLVWIGSLWDTWGKLQLETSAEDSDIGRKEDSSAG